MLIICLSHTQQRRLVCNPCEKHKLRSVRGIHDAPVVKTNANGHVAHPNKRQKLKKKGDSDDEDEDEIDDEDDLHGIKMTIKPPTSITLQRAPSAVSHTSSGRATTSLTKSKSEKAQSIPAHPFQNSFNIQHALANSAPSFPNTPLAPPTPLTAFIENNGWADHGSLTMPSPLETCSPFITPKMPILIDYPNHGLPDLALSSPSFRSHDLTSRDDDYGHLSLLNFNMRKDSGHLI
jgi:hypothetical protein